MAVTLISLFSTRKRKSLVCAFEVQYRNLKCMVPSICLPLMLKYEICNIMPLSRHLISSWYNNFLWKMMKILIVTRLVRFPWRLLWSFLCCLFQVLEALDTLKKKPDAQAEEVLTIEKLIAEAYSVIDKAVKVGTLHRNTGARRKSRLARRKKDVEIHHGWYTRTPVASSWFKAHVRSQHRSRIRGEYQKWDDNYLSFWNIHYFPFCIVHIVQILISFLLEIAHTS